MKSATLSVVIPVFNEENTISAILKEIADVALINNIEKEIIIVNDFSSDNTDKEIMKYIADNPASTIKYLVHNKNMGKGAAIHTGIGNANGDYLIIQDADLEYDPNEYNLLLRPMVDGFADVVYGSRFIGGSARRILFYWHYVGNKYLTFLSNMFTNLNLTDMESCYKLFKADIIKGLELQEQRFGFEPEVTAKIAKIKNVRIYEVGISYYGRTYAEGKKIGWRDGINAIYCILKYNLLKQADGEAIMIVGLCGSHRTGKSTLAETISHRTGIPFLRTTTSQVFKKYGIDPSKPMGFKKRLWIQFKILETAEKVWSVNKGQFVTDRTPLDMVAYTLADIQGATEVDSAELEKYLICCFEVTNRFFDLLVLIQPAIPLVHEEGKAALNEGYLEHLNYLILGLCNDERLQSKIFSMPRSVISIDDRVTAILNVIAEKDIIAS